MTAKIFASVSFSISALFFTFFIILMYASKSKYKTYENKVFISLLVIAIFLIFNEFAYVYALVNYDTTSFIVNFLCRSYLSFVTIWLLLFIMYILVIYTKNEVEYIKVKKRKTYAIILTIVAGVAILISSLLPLEFYDYENSTHLYGFGGLATITMYAIAGVLMLLVIIVFSNKKLQFKDKNIVFFSISVIAGATLIQIFIPNADYNIQNFQFILMLMALFFTLENQDNKLLDEHSAQIAEAEKASQEKTEFLTSVSHEIRTPINTIMGFSDILIREGATDQNIVKKDTKYINIAAESLLFLINNILDLSRIESKKETLVEKEYNMQDLMLEVFEFVNNRIDTSKVKFNLYVDPNMSKMYHGDYAKTSKIITNVLFNVMNYTKEGTINLNISGFKSNNEIFSYMIQVTSEGSYIKPDEYNKYYLNDLQTTNKVNKAVLGVTISKQYVDMIGGTVTFNGNNGKNISYSITLNTSIVDPNPVGDINKLFTGELADDQAFDLSGKKILVVDDNNVNIKLFLRMLEQYNADTSSAKSGKECIDLVGKNKYDALFIDHMMPGMDGIETLSKLKDLYSDLPPAIALTANASTGIREEYKSEGFYDYLGKPIDKGELNKLLFELFKK